MTAAAAAVLVVAVVQVEPLVEYQVYALVVSICLVVAGAKESLFSSILSPARLQTR